MTAALVFALAFVGRVVWEALCIMSNVLLGLVVVCMLVAVLLVAGAGLVVLLLALVLIDAADVKDVIHDRPSRG